jgi:hypothetical protein
MFYNAIPQAFAGRRAIQMCLITRIVSSDRPHPCSPIIKGTNRIAHLHVTVDMDLSGTHLLPYAGSQSLDVLRAPPKCSCKWCH